VALLPEMRFRAEITSSISNFNVKCALLVLVRLVSMLKPTVAHEPPARDEDWQLSPIIVGGTGGSGTRGSVSVLSKLGVYMVSQAQLQISLFSLLSLSLSLSCSLFFYR